MSRRVLIDCTSTLEAPFQTGIQRVVRNLIEHGATEGGMLTVTPFVFGPNGLFEVRRSQLVVRPQNTKHGRWVGRQDWAPWQRSLQRLPYRLSKIVYPRKFAQAVRHMRLQMSSQPLALSPNDTILLADASWRNTNWNALTTARKRGVSIGAVIYDLIPITHPHLLGEGLCLHFTNWLGQVHEHSDFLLTISESTGRELARYQQAQGLSPKPTLPFRLGSTLRPHTQGLYKQEHVSPRLRKLFTEETTSPLTTFVMVGTLDPHKNHRCVIQAFDQLWKLGHAVRLMIVGRKGRNADDLLHAIRSHPQWHDKLIGIDDASDADIAFLYQHMRALIFASYTEGFGLPIVEALQQQRSVIASDIPVHREVAGAHACYFRSNDADHLCQTILEQLQVSEPAPASEDMLRCNDAPQNLVLDWPIAARLALQKCVQLAELATSQGQQLAKAS
jgi:glycosyltransferase involved in cell wall biosynthesis